MFNKEKKITMYTITENNLINIYKYIIYKTKYLSY